VQVELLAPRTLGLVGPVLAEDADRLLEAIASLAPGGPITLDLTEVTSIDEGGIVAIRRAATKAHDIGGGPGPSPSPIRDARPDPRKWFGRGTDDPGRGP
jgi:hypothetical protein